MSSQIYELVIVFEMPPWLLVSSGNQAAGMLIAWNGNVLVQLETESQLPVIFQYQVMIENVDACFLNIK